jgi:hypothetical protein
VLVTHWFEPPAPASQDELMCRAQPATQTDGPIGCPHDEVDGH